MGAPDLELRVRPQRGDEHGERLLRRVPVQRVDSLGRWLPCAPALDELVGTSSEVGAVDAYRRSLAVACLRSLTT